MALNQTPDLATPKKRPDLTPEEKARRRKRRIKGRIWFYSIVFLVMYGSYWYQPYEFDWIPRHIPSPNPSVDPDSKELFSNKAKVLIVTAHPDDSEFFIGGILAKLSSAGASIDQVICTDGDKGYYLFFTDAAKNKVVRRQEAQAAATAWHGHTLEFLGYPDRFLHPNPNVIDAVEAAIRRVKPDYIFAFDGDYPPRGSHQDHRRSGDIAKIAAEQTHIAKWLLLFSTIAPNYIVDISNQWEDQKRLLEIHRSQFFGSHLEGVESMVEFNAEKDGEIGGFTLGEGLRCIRLK